MLTFTSKTHITYPTCFTNVNDDMLPMMTCFTFLFVYFFACSQFHFLAFFTIIYFFLFFFGDTLISLLFEREFENEIYWFGNRTVCMSMNFVYVWIQIYSNVFFFCLMIHWWINATSMSHIPNNIRSFHGHTVAVPKCGRLNWVAATQTTQKLHQIFQLPYMWNENDDTLQI